MTKLIAFNPPRDHVLVGRTTPVLPPCVSPPPPNTHARMCSLHQRDVHNLSTHTKPATSIFTLHPDSSRFQCWHVTFGGGHRQPVCRLYGCSGPQKPLTSRHLLWWSITHSQPTHHHPSPSYPVRRPFAVAVLACDVAWSHRQPVSWCYCYSWCCWWVAEQQIQLGTAAQLTRRVADSKHPAGGRGEGRKDEQIV